MKVGKIKPPYTQVSNVLIEDPRLSFKAKGIYAYIYSKPEDWDFSSKRMILETSDKLKAVQHGLKELEKYGYLKRNRQQSGRIEYIIDVLPGSPYGSQRFGLKAETAPISNTYNNTNTKEKVSNVNPTDSQDKTRKHQPEEQLPPLPEVVNLLDADKRRHISIIALYLDYRQNHLKPYLKTYGQLSEFITRHSRAAVKLKAWDDNQLLRAFAEVDKKYKDIDWTMETCVKHLTK
jgi:hypothetical protein